MVVCVFSKARLATNTAARAVLPINAIVLLPHLYLSKLIGGMLWVSTNPFMEQMPYNLRVEVYSKLTSWSPYPFMILVELVRSY